ncbi:glycosyltransferase [Lutimaribacter marinistellae]|uniref:Glycosyltransferase n=1 Tax=Lutimaribacter marinistellae TaxID=1820329 RepID=A0ABV7TN83_9RHOB
MATLFITLGAPFFRWQGELWQEGQTISGLKAWQEHFDKIIACGLCKDEKPPEDCRPLEAEGIRMPEFEMLALPDGYHLPTYFRTRREIEARFLDAMRRSDYVSVAIGGWIGDWGVVAARVAQRNGIPHAVWFDRVESQVLAAAGGSGVKDRMKAAIKSTVTARAERDVLKGADLALLHGRTVFEALAPLSRNPHLVEDIHLEEGDRISAPALASKLAAVPDAPLRIVYAGRAHKMKGGLHWVEVLQKIARKGVAFSAEWAGDGDMLEAMQEQVRDAGLEEQVSFPGFVSDRDQVLELLRGGHLLMFCHLTDESPRILIEALHAATPLVGYRDAFAEGLVTEQGAGHLVERGDIDALAEAVADLAQDRTLLGDLVSRAARSARHLTRAQVFAHRSDIIKQNLKPLGEVS